MNARAVCASSSAISKIFAPPIHARSPAPDTTTARRSLRAPISSIAAMKSRINARPRMFSLRRLSTVRKATSPPSRDSSRTSMRGDVSLCMQEAYSQVAAKPNLPASEGGSMLRRSLFRGAIAAAAGAFTLSARAEAPVRQKVAYHLADLDKVSFVLGNLRNHINATGGPGGAALVLVVHGPALDAFTKKSAKPEFAKQLADT